MYDFCDGEVYKEHSLFSVDSEALQIIIYYDEVETSNPLGSYRGRHKLGKYTCVNMHACMDIIICVHLYIHAYFLPHLPNSYRSLLLFPWKY